ncbi:MAG: tetratricopeptide repeat protein [Desulfopila sp.]
MNGRLSLFYLGHHVFGIFSTTMEPSRFAAIAKRVLLWLRRDGFRRIHLGLGLGQGDKGERQDIGQPSLYALDRAEFALDQAQKRGPFSLCDYFSLSQPHKHPLRKPTKALLAKFWRKWKEVDSFSILELQPCSLDKKDILVQRLPAENIVQDDQDLYVFLPGIPPDAALTWWQEYVEDNAPGPVQVGIGYFPHRSFSKSATVFHCRKALNHARFFGPEGRAIFDAVSLNVSGDIYYAEGDLTSAVAEYRAGIACEQNNVNLLNSLGVSYADMDKHREARLCFERVLTLDPCNFMALYNSALEADLTGRYETAYTFLEKAYVLLDDHKEGGEELRDDIRYRYGRLCCITGRHQKAVEVLLEWYDHEPFTGIKDKALPYLGQSYYGLGKYDTAVNWLQKALRYDEFDSDSMGLLGRCYLILGQGDEIALALCQKSTELDPDKSILRIHLARAQIACMRYDEAKATLRKCLPAQGTKTEAQLLMCMNYYRKGMVKPAAQWLEKVYANVSLEPGVACEAHQLDTQIGKQIEVYNAI